MKVNKKKDGRELGKGKSDKIYKDEYTEKEKVDK